MDVERSRLVVRVKLVIASLKINRVGPANAGGVNAPGVIGIQRDQRVVKIKKSQLLHLGVVHHGFNQGYGDAPLGLQGIAVKQV